MIIIIFSLLFPFHPFRGLTCPPNIIDQLHECTEKLRSVLDKNMAPVLTQWLLHAIKVDHNNHICILNAHLALMVQNVKNEDLTKFVQTTF